MSLTTRPMFPLGTVLFPTAVLPLHVFEPRYRQLVADCTAGDGAFGVVLIERGSEVGGGDVRTDVGTVAQIAEARELADGRFLVAAVGTARVRVTEWLDDDPYPRAVVDEWPDADLEGPVPAFEGLTDTLGRFRRVLGLRAELGEPAPPATSEVADDPVLASYQMAALAPFGPADQQRLLAVPGATARLALLDTLLDDEAGFLEQRLAGG
jgi:Lon protease-like protein